MSLKSFFILVGALIVLPVSGFAQDQASSGADLDEVISTGTLRPGDPAMSAFFRGDFATAEIEFDKNFRNLKRIENGRQNTLTQARTDQTTATIRGGLPQTGARGGTAQTANTNVSLGLSGLRKTARQDGRTVTSGTDKGFQLYMMGLSQIQLGKYGEAKDSMTRAIRLNKTIYDARTRLGLLELREQNFDAAREQLIRLDKLRKKCAKRCKHKDEIRDSTLTLARELAKG